MKIENLNTGNIPLDFRRSSVVLFLVYISFSLIGFAMNLIFPPPFPRCIKIMDIGILVILLLAFILLYGKVLNLKLLTRIVIYAVVADMFISDLYAIFCNMPGWAYIIYHDAFVITLSLIVSGYICGYKQIVVLSLAYGMILVVAIVCFLQKGLAVDIFFSLMMFVFGSSFSLIIYRRNLLRTMKKKLFLQKEINRSNKDVFQKEVELTKNKSEHLKEMLEQKNRELTSCALLIARNNERNKLLQKKLDELPLLNKELQKKEVKEIKSLLTESGTPKSWERFQKRFEEVHPDFYKKLVLKIPSLTPAERKLCTLIRLGLTSKEIASLSYNTAASVDVARSRLRKKLQLERTESIESFLVNL